MKKIVILSAFFIFGCPSVKKDCTFNQDNQMLAKTFDQKVEVNKNQTTEHVEKIYQLKQGQTLTHVLKPYGVDSADIFKITKALAPHILVNKMQVGHKINLFIKDKEIKSIQIPLSLYEQVKLIKKGDNWLANKMSLEVLTRYKRLSGKISGSFYQSALTSKVPVSVINQFMLAYSHSVDFQRSIKHGDSFRLLYTENYLKTDSSIKWVDKIAYAELTLSDKTKRLYRFADPQNGDSFYDETGKQANSFLLKTPLEGARLSSHFGKRKHPVLGYTRIHKGIDFGAPKGTPILAAGNGIIEKAGRAGSFGNLVRIKHKNGYQSLYAHLNGFASGIKKGVKVDQGQVIGYLGNTGLSQARHLHYEIHKDGKAINPLKLKQSGSIKLKGKQLIAFQKVKKQIWKHFI